MEHPLPQRTTEVLHAIVQSYIESGEPVASRTIARRRRDSLSPATIRNIMADLADLGYLAQPHTSAGRVPTEKAFRHFAQTHAAGRTLEAELQKLRAELNRIESSDDRAEQASHILTHLTSNVGIVAAIPDAEQTLDQIELVLLADMRVLMVVVTRDGVVRNQVVRLDEPATQDELASIRNYVNRNFSGWIPSRIRDELARRMARESATYDALMRKLAALYDRGLLDVGLQPRVFLDGTSNLLVSLDLQFAREKLRELFRTLEEKRKILELLDRFLAGKPGELTVQVGLEAAHPYLRGLSLIGVTLRLAGGLSTRIAVLGPMRMNYPRVISAVNHVGQALRGLPEVQPLPGLRQ